MTMTMQEHVKRVREALDYYWENSVMLHRSNSIKANADDSLMVIERALTPPDDLRELAEEIANEIYVDALVHGLENDREAENILNIAKPFILRSVLKALQAVQRAEREKAELLYQNLESMHQTNQALIKKYRQLEDIAKTVNIALFYLRGNLSPYGKDKKLWDMATKALVAYDASKEKTE